MYRSTVSSRIIGCCFAGALLWAMPGHVYAWGAAGHRIVGHMACDLLSPEVRAAIQSLMGSVDLATFALHLDQRKQQLEQQIPESRTWHYDNAPVCTTASYAQYCPNGACTSTQLLRHYRLLSDVHEPRSRKLFAIFVLTHLVGDIHQPLHAVWDKPRHNFVYTGGEFSRPYRAIVNPQNCRLCLFHIGSLIPPLCAPGGSSS